MSNNHLVKVVFIVIITLTSLEKFSIYYLNRYEATNYKFLRPAVPLTRQQIKINVLKFISFELSGSKSQFEYFTFLDGQKCR